MKSDRTTLITAVAVAGVLIAGTAAVAANIGILNATTDTTIGSLTATDNLVPAAPVDVQSVVEVSPTPDTPVPSVVDPVDVVPAAPVAQSVPHDDEHSGGHDSYEGANDDD
jgi:hypothetical protein